MDFVKFLEKTRYIPKIMISGDDFLERQMHKSVALKNLTNAIDYKCGVFGPDDKCPGVKNGDWPAKGCCCKNCASDHGYFRFIPVELARKLAKHFNEKTGFWRAGKGCVLKRSERSVTCVDYNCFADSKMKESMFQFGLILRDLDTKIQNHYQEKINQDSRWRKEFPRRYWENHRSAGSPKIFAGEI